MGPTGQLIAGLLVLLAIILAGIAYNRLWLDRRIAKQIKFKPPTEEIEFKPPDVKVAQKVTVEKDQDRSTGCLLIVCLAALAGISYLVYWSFLEPTHKPPDLLGGQAACSACLQFVTDSLETPSTAVFPSRFGSNTQITD
jgi:hypothetical protein